MNERDIIEQARYKASDEGKREKREKDAENWDSVRKQEQSRREREEIEDLVERNISRKAEKPDVYKQNPGVKNKINPIGSVLPDALRDELDGGMYDAANPDIFYERDYVIAEQERLRNLIGREGGLYAGKYASGDILIPYPDMSQDELHFIFEKNKEAIHEIRNLLQDKSPEQNLEENELEEDAQNKEEDFYKG